MSKRQVDLSGHDASASRERSTIEIVRAIGDDKTRVVRKVRAAVSARG